MDRYLTGENVWPDGWTKLRVYFTPRFAEIKPFIEAVRPVLEECEFVAPIRDEFLHETLAALQDRPAASVSAEEFARFESLLRERLAGFAPFTVTAGGAMASRRGVMLDVSPDAEFVSLRHGVRSVMETVFGAGSAHYAGGRPHIALAYGSGPGDSGLLQGRLRNATGVRVAITVDSVRIVEATQHVERDEVHWEDRGLIPLGEGLAAA